MAKKRKAKASTAKAHKSGLSPIMQFGVVFIIVFAMILLMYAAKLYP